MRGTSVLRILSNIFGLTMLVSMPAHAADLELPKNFRPWAQDIQKTHEMLDDEKIDQVSDSQAWLKLIHYRRHWITGSYYSNVAGQGFFFAENGNEDPRAELIASIAAFGLKDLKVGRFGLPSQCAFPERYRFLKEKFQLKTEDVTCERFDDYMSRFNAKSVSIVFSSSYPNSPASMFGHTFLKFNSGIRSDLLDNSISYAAKVGEDDSSLGLALWGVFGGYIGQWSMLPYYAKVEEYNNSESRDLWEYELNLSQAETRRLLAHLWEIETNSYFDYYFFDDNCSYQLLTAIEAIKPEWNISQHSFYVIPAESIKNLGPKQIHSIKFRPSLKKKFLQSYNSMDSQERKTFRDLIGQNTDPQKVKNPFVLQTASNYLLFEMQKESNRTRYKILNEKILQVRATLPNEAPRKMDPISEETRPDLGHDPFSASLIPGLHTMPDSSWTYFQELRIKSAYHDLMNKDLGFAPYSQIDFPYLVLRYEPNNGNLFVEKLNLIDLVSIAPLKPYDHDFSWRVKLGIDSPKDYGCYNCQVGDVRLGGGYAMNLFSDRNVGYAMLDANLQFGSSLASTNSYRVGPDLETAIILNPFNNYKLRGDSTIFWDAAQGSRGTYGLRPSYTWQLKVEQSIALSKKWETRQSFLQVQPLQLGTTPGPTDIGQNKYYEAKLEINYYFR